jgi:regulator of sigma E protease
MTAVVQSAITIVIFVFMLGALVVIHELGHFLTARLAGVRVHEFGIGFPPRAKVMRSHGETLYTLNWLPIGGFVRLEGEDGESDDPRSFVRASLPTKLIILIAGVAMNIALAFTIFFLIAWLANPTVGLTFDKVQPDSPALAAGLIPGDRIDSLDGKVFDAFGASPGRSAIVDALHDSAGQTVTLGITHADGSTAAVPVSLRPTAQIDSTHGALGIEIPRGAPTGAYFQRTPLEAAQIAVVRTGQALTLIWSGLGQLADSIVNHPTEAPPVSGPIGIASQVGDVFWQLGPVFTLYLAGILSANLALVNILPFPPLDGGRIAILLLKSVAGERVSLRAERLTYLVGFVFLMTFLAWISFYDITAPGRGQ